MKLLLFDLMTNDSKLIIREIKTKKVYTVDYSGYEKGEYRCATDLPEDIYMSNVILFTSLGYGVVEVFVEAYDYLGGRRNARS